MNKLLIIIFFISVLTFSCSENPKHDKQKDSQENLTQKINDSQVPQEELVVNDSANILETFVPFKYKELLENYLDSPEKIETSTFYGSWTITDISSVGGTIQKERTIRNQLGNKLQFSKNKCSFNFLGSKSDITYPESHIKTIDIEDDSEIKGTTYFFGYRPQRKQIKILVINDIGHFEIINYSEIAIYYDGRIYFLHKD